MHPHYFPFLGMFLGGLLRPVPRRTDADRLRDLEAAEQAHLAKLANPVFIAAQAKRERKRAKRIQQQRG
jgi:hypothetical protein